MLVFQRFGRRMLTLSAIDTECAVLAYGLWFDPGLVGIAMGDPCSMDPCGKSGLHRA